MHDDMRPAVVAAIFVTGSPLRFIPATTSLRTLNRIHTIIGASAADTLEVLKEVADELIQVDSPSDLVAHIAARCSAHIILTTDAATAPPSLLERALDALERDS